MARMTFNKASDYAAQLSRLSTGCDEITKKAIYAGADVLADEIRKNIQSLPEEKFRYLRNGDTFQALTRTQKKDLLDSLGITPIEKDKSDNWNAKIGFDGFGSKPTDDYPKGVPNQLLARSIESGSSVRAKRPFVRPAVNAVRRKVEAEMGRVVNEEIEKLMRR